MPTADLGLGIGIPAPPRPPTLDREATRRAAQAGSLCALVIAGTQVDSEIDRAVFLIRTLEVELALGYATRAARAKAGAK